MPVVAIQPASSPVLEHSPAAGVVELASRRPPRATAELTERERQVLEQLARGRTTEEMAESLFLSTHTVRSHVKTMLQKVGARTRAHAVAIGFADGALDV